MRGKRRILALLVTLMLFAGMTIPASAANLYFTAINDSVSPLTSSTMPVWSGGTLYVPYTVFDANLNGIGVSLGMYTTYSRETGTVTLFNLRQMLVFDLNDGTCRDEMTGTVYASRAIMRNGRPYLALGLVCTFFELEYSYVQLPNIPQSYLVRIKSAEAVMDDAGFVEAARNLFNNRLREYTQSLGSAETTNPETPPTVPSRPDGGESTGAAVYLAFRCESAAGLSGILDALDREGQYAAFFLPAGLLEEEGDLVRRILGRGHSLGILADGEGAEEGLELGNQALERAVHTRTTLVCAPAGRWAELEEAGWVCWKETQRFAPAAGVTPGTFAANVMGRLEARRRTVYLTLEGGEDTARVLPALLRQLDSSHYSVAVPVETRL